MGVIVKRVALAALAAILTFAVTLHHSIAQKSISLSDSVQPARLVSLKRRIEVHADGSATVYTHYAMQIQSPQLISLLAQPSIDYSDALDSLEIKDAYTLKPDGTKIDVSPGSIITRQKSLPAPLFTDLKEKVILFPNVEAGDTTVYDAVLQTRAHIPGQFYTGFFILRSIEIDDETVTYVAPKDVPLKFDLYGITLVKGTEGDNNTYTVHYENRAPIFEPQQFLWEYDLGLRVYATTASSYDALAQNYASMIMPKTAVTPKIQAKADEITAGISDRREQARKLYEWVSTHVRYVAVLFGDGGIVPHDADSVLTNAFGDCKDHATLYSALLKAKGIPSELVVINGTNGYTVPKTAALLSFNHMIVWLPEFSLYADTTSNVTPFGSLPQLEYGKPVIHVGGHGEALRNTPILSERDSTYSSSTIVRLSDDGIVTGQQTATGSGAMAAVLRSLGNITNASGASAVAANVLHQRKLDSAAGTYNFQETSDLSPSYTYTSTYQTGRVTVPQSGFSMPEGLNIVDATSPVLLGPASDARFKDADNLPCFGGNATDDYSFTFPASKKLLAMPQDAQIDTANIHYASHWSLSGNTVSVHHEIHAHFDTGVCSGDVLRETRQAVVKIRLDYVKLIVLSP